MTHAGPEKFPRTIHAFRRTGSHETREILKNRGAMSGVVKLVRVTIHSSAAGPCRIRYDSKRVVIETRPGEAYTLDAGCFSQ